MRWTLAVIVAVVGLGLGGPVFGQTPVEGESAQQEAPHFEIVPLSPATRDATKPNDADFYRDDVRVRHEPAFIEPFVGRTPGGNQWGLSGWTAPNLPVGSYGSQGYGENSGFLALGITFLFDYPPKGAVRPTSAPR